MLMHNIDKLRQEYKEVTNAQYAAFKHYTQEEAKELQRIGDIEIKRYIRALKKQAEIDMIEEGKIYEQFALLNHWSNRLQGIVVQLKMAGDNVPADLIKQKTECLVAMKAALEQLERLMT